MKPKVLPPTLREKDRYIVFEVISDGDFTLEDLIKATRISFLSLFGELGLSECGIRFLRNLYDEKNKRGVIRCVHNKIEEVRTALAFIRKVNEVNVIVRVLGITGTVKSARKKFLGQTNLIGYGE